MVEKQVFDSFLAKNLKKQNAFNSILLADKEGILIAYAGRKGYIKHKPITYAALTQSLFAKAYHYATSYSLSYPILTLTFMPKSFLLQIRLSDGYCTCDIDYSNWPFNEDELKGFLIELDGKLKTLKEKKKKSSLLKELFPEGKDQEGRNTFDINVPISLILECISSLPKGNFGDLQWSVSSSSPQDLLKEVGGIISNYSLNSAIVSEKEEIYYASGSSAEKMAKLMGKTLTAHVKDFELEQMGAPLISIYCYAEGEAVIDNLLGTLEDKKLCLAFQLPSWKSGIYPGLSMVYSAVKITQTQLHSPETTQIMDVFSILMSDVDDLRERIEAYLNQGNYEMAIKLMKRSITILLNRKEYSIAGDYFKWIAFTYYNNKDYEKAAGFYEKAAECYERAEDWENYVADLTDLASLYEVLKNPLKAVIEYGKVREIYSQFGADEHAQSIDQKITELQKDVETQVNEFITSYPGNSIPVKEMAKTFKIELELMRSVLNELIQSGIVNGTYNSLNDTLDKMMTPSPQTMAGTRPMMTNNYSQAPSQSMPQAVPGIKNVYYPDYSRAFDELNRLKKENIKLEAELRQNEDQFLLKGVRFTDFLKYQARLGKKNLNELKIKIYSEMPQFNDENGTPITCAICLETLEPSETIITDENGHGFHSKCLAKWIKSQDRCPVCDVKLLPYVFRDYRLGSGAAIGADPREIAELHEQINILKQSLGPNADLYEKLVKERETKNKLMAELKRKEQIINELKSMLKTLRR